MLLSDYITRTVQAMPMRSINDVYINSQMLSNMGDINSIIADLAETSTFMALDDDNDFYTEVLFTPEAKASIIESLLNVFVYLGMSNFSSISSVDFDIDDGIAIDHLGMGVVDTKVDYLTLIPTTQLMNNISSIILIDYNYGDEKPLTSDQVFAKLTLIKDTYTLLIHLLLFFDRNFIELLMQRLEKIELAYASGNI